MFELHVTHLYIILLYFMQYVTSHANTMIRAIAVGRDTCGIATSFILCTIYLNAFYIISYCNSVTLMHGAGVALSSSLITSCI